MSNIGEKTTPPRAPYIQQPVAYQGEPGPLITTYPITDANLSRLVLSRIGDHPREALGIMSLERRAAVLRLPALPHGRVARAEIVFPRRHVAIVDLISRSWITDQLGTRTPGHYARSRQVCVPGPEKLCTAR